MEMYEEIKRPLTLEALDRLKKVQLNDFRQYESGKCWNGGCYSYHTRYIKDENGKWFGEDWSSCDLVDPEPEWEATPEEVLYFVKRQFEELEKGSPEGEVMSVELDDEEGVLRFTLDRD